MGKTFYRISAVLLILFALGHTLGFSQPPDPAWKADAVVASMKSVHFDILGSQRNYWDFFLGDGYTVSIFFVFAAILGWQFARVSPAKSVAWAFAATFACLTILSCIYLFVVPIVFSSLITVSLGVAAWYGPMRESPRCSFCRKGPRDVKKPIAGPHVQICDECVGICVGVIGGEGSPAE